MYGSRGGFSKSDQINFLGEVLAGFLYVYSSWYCRATTGNPRCFCKTDDDNKSTLHLIKQVKENSSKDAVKTFYILMMQVGISGFKSRTGEEARANSIEKPAYLELSCSMKYYKCYGR